MEVGTMLNEKRLTIAVLIDADNMPARCLPQLTNWLAEHGEAKLWRAYGNINTFQSPDCDWVKVAGERGIDVRVLLPVMDGKKNTADTAMMLDAMELAITGQCEALCLVSRDSDFRQLALKLKTRVPVYGLVMGDVSKCYLAALTEYSIFSDASVKEPLQASVRELPQKSKKNSLEVVLLSAFQSACGDKEYCLKTMLGTKLSALRSQLPQPLRTSKNNLLNKVLNEMRLQCGYELFEEEGSKQNTIVRLKK